MGALTKQMANRVEDTLMKPEMQARMMDALGNNVDPRRLVRVAVMEINNTPKLAECSPASLLVSIMDAGKLGLQIGGSLGQAYLVPYGRTCQMLIGWRGLIDLAMRSGKVSTIEPWLVYEGERFEIEQGSAERFVHVPDVFAPPGREIRGGYMIAKMKDGGVIKAFMAKHEIDAIRARSRSGKNGPWVTDYEEMAKKTLIRRGCKLLPLTIDAKEAIEADDKRWFSVDASADHKRDKYADAAHVEPSDEPEIIDATDDTSDGDDWYEEGGKNMAQGGNE